MDDSHQDPKVIFKQLLEGNVRYAEKHCPEFEQLKLKQTPKVTLLACCDSRVPQNLFDVAGPNEIFAVRNIGNQFENSGGSVMYSILHLHTPLLIVMGHTGCGAIKASLSDYRGDEEAIQREVIGLIDSIRTANRNRDMPKISDENQKLAVYAQVNVDVQVSRITAKASVNEKIKKQELCVVGMIFDIHGVYGGKLADAYVTNINGETDIQRMKKQDIAAEVDAGLRELKFKRL
jgi:carbonic anhydrase